jgi:hypothetical protein
MRRSDCLPSIPPRFVAFAWRYRSCARPFAPVVAERCHVTGQGSLINQSPRSGSTRGGDRPSQVPGGTPLCTCPARRPRRDLSARPCRRFDAAFRNSNNVGSRNIGLSGLSHTACTLAVYASSPASPLTTQDSLPIAGQALPGGIGYPLGSLTRVSDLLFYISSPLARLSWRT